MPRDYANPQWLTAIAGILHRQARRSRDPNHANLTERLAGYFEAQAMAARKTR
jgi:hypothetical protein